jgi:hypothetical protein
MTAVHKHIGTLMLLLSYAAAQDTAGTATVQNIAIAREGTDLRVEVTLSAPVKPSVETAIHPDRILLDLPDTICTDKTKKVDVHTNGVNRVRAGQHSTSPLITRVVLDLDQAHPYRLKSEGNRIILIVSSTAAARETHPGAPAAATSGTLIGIFRRKQGTLPSVAEDSAPAPAEPTPPPSTAAVAIPASSSSASALPPATVTTSVPPNPAATVSSENSAGQGSFSQNQIEANARGGNAPTVVAGGFPSRDVSATPIPKAEDISNGAREPESPVPVAPTASPAPASAEATPEVSVAAPPMPVDTSNGDVRAESPAPAVPAPSSVPTAAEAPTMIARTDDPSLHTVFKVKYVAEGVAYLDGGRAQGLAEGMKLVIEDSNLPAKQGDSADASDPRVVAWLEVSAVAETSAVTDIHTPKRPVKVGDLAYLSSSDAAALVQQRALSATRQYPVVISFTEGDTLDEEAREEVPRPPLPSVNRARGRIGLDYMETVSHGSTSMTSSDVGMAFRGDITRIGGSYWNLSGYWRGRLTKSSAASQQTLQNLINRTYHLSMTYDNPNSSLVAGFGRLYLPWAPSLDTIDGGYFGRRLSKGTTLGIFGGSTPDPSSWNYSPDRVMGGAFINFEGGQYDGLHYSSTSGGGLSMVKWQTDRPFIFFEDSISYKRYVAVYESAQLDDPRGNSQTPSPGPGLGRNFLTFRVTPHPRTEFDFNYNYFRDIPTFDTTLIGTGLLDKFLFQGFSAGARVEVMKQVWVSTNLGRSSRTGDAKSSLNEMYGLTFGRLPWLRLRADAHYARFNSSFGSGSYEAFSVSRQFSDNLRLEVLAGQQNFTSAVTTNNRARFVTGTVETTLGPHYYMQGSFTTNRGQLSYDQFMFSLGYRFDSKKHKE